MSMNEANKEAIERNNGINVLVSSTGCWGEKLGNEKLPIGTKVVYTNDFGISFPGRTIVKTGSDDYGDTYFLEPSDTPWVGCRRRNLTIEYIKPTT